MLGWYRLFDQLEEKNGLNASYETKIKDIKAKDLSLENWFSSSGHLSWQVKEWELIVEAVWLKEVHSESQIVLYFI